MRQLPSHQVTPMETIFLLLEKQMKSIIIMLHTSIKVVLSTSPVK